MNPTIKKPRREKAGVKEQTVGYFYDVDRALSAYLRKTDPRFMKASEEASRRNAEVKARRDREREEAQP